MNIASSWLPNLAFLFTECKSLPLLSLEQFMSRCWFSSVKCFPSVVNIASNPCFLIAKCKSFIPPNIPEHFMNECRFLSVKIAWSVMNMASSLLPNLAFLITECKSVPSYPLSNSWVDVDSISSVKCFPSVCEHCFQSLLPHCKMWVELPPYPTSISWILILECWNCPKCCEHYCFIIASKPCFLLAECKSLGPIPLSISWMECSSWNYPKCCEHYFGILLSLLQIKSLSPSYPPSTSRMLNLVCMCCNKLRFFIHLLMQNSNLDEKIIKTQVSPLNKC